MALRRPPRAQLADGRAGVYGYVHRVVLEPGVEAPSRVQLWGVFVVAAAADRDGYHAPERGYLYFSVPSDSRQAVADWLELKRLVDTNVSRITPIAFGDDTMHVRVRTSDEAPTAPDTYVPGAPPSQASTSSSTAGRMLGRLPKPPSSMNYAVVENAIIERRANETPRLQIWGTFAIGDENEAKYAALQHGYLYFSSAGDRRSLDDVLAQWEDWQSAAVTQQIVGFYVFSYFHLTVRVRPPDEVPSAPDAYTPVTKDPFVIRPDTEYAPIRSLRMQQARAHVEALIASFKLVKPSEPQLAAELTSLREDDQRYRKEGVRLWNEKGPDSPEAKAVWDKQTALDVKNQARLTLIVEQHGWPGVHLVGLTGADAAFLILDHAPAALQKKYLPRLEAATAALDVLPMWAAMVSDRVRMGDGQPQLYGTQLRMLPGSRVWQLYPIEDERHVDDRRALVGFEPLADYLKSFGITYTPPR